MDEVKGLIARVQQGDMYAFEELVRAYQEKIYSLAFALAGNHADAEDLAQEILLKVYIALPNFVNDERGFDAWVHRIGVNLWIDWWRRRKKVQIFSLDAGGGTDDGGISWEIASEGNNPEEELKKKEFWRALWRTMGELPENCRVALKLRAIDGYSYKEITVILKNSEAGLKSQLNRCRQRLKQKLAAAGFYL